MQENEDKFPKVISIKLGPIKEPINLLVDYYDKIGDIIEKIKIICEERNIDLDKWAKDKLGTEKFSFLMVRKGIIEEINSNI